MALSSRTITASINYRCAPFSATLMHRGRRAALKTPSDACAEDCRGKLIWPRCPINALLSLVRSYNHTPRKCLNYKTPAEVFCRDLLHFKCESTLRLSFQWGRHVGAST